MPLNTIYQVRARQTFDTNGKELETVWFFDHTAGSGTASDLAVAFGAARGDLMNAFQTELIKNYSIDVINLGDLGDFASLPWVGTGALAQDTLPPFNAVGFTMKVNTRAVRKGSKRVSGLAETDVTNGEITGTTTLANIELLRIAMAQEIVDASDTWLPIVVKRIKTAVAGTTPTQYKYRLPEPGDPLVTGEVITVLTTRNVSHQVSRTL